MECINGILFDPAEGVCERMSMRRSPMGSSS